MTAGSSAVDVETEGRPFDIEIWSRFGPVDSDEFLARWTVAEVLAKLNDVPILTWLYTHGLPEKPVKGRWIEEMPGGDAQLWHVRIPEWRSIVTCGQLIESEV